MKCYKAIGLYKGSYYTAWYANEIPYSDGPWKFSGLPGLILEIESKDRGISIRVEKIVLNPKIKMKAVTIEFTELYTWDETF